MQGTFQVLSVGVNKHGASVMQVITPSRAIIEIATNVIGLSKLAAAGCPVENAYGVNAGKVQS